MILTLIFVSLVMQNDLVTYQGTQCILKPIIEMAMPLQERAYYVLR